MLSPSSEKATALIASGRASVSKRSRKKTGRTLRNSNDGCCQGRHEPLQARGSTKAPTTRVRERKKKSKWLQRESLRSDQSCRDPRPPLKREKQARRTWRREHTCQGQVEPSLFFVTPKPPTHHCPSLQTAPAAASIPRRWPWFAIVRFACRGKKIEQARFACFSASQHQLQLSTKPSEFAKNFDVLSSCDEFQSAPGASPNSYGGWRSESRVHEPKTIASERHFFFFYFTFPALRLNSPPCLRAATVRGWPP